MKWKGDKILIMQSLNNRTKSACYGCEERYLGCHRECEKYKEFKNEIEKQKKYKQDYINKKQWREDLKYDYRRGQT